LKISIITPTFNSQNTIEANIKSVIKQNFENWEQIIIDNCSTDKTIEIIKNFNDSRISVFSENDKGIYDALNKGIKKSTGDIISILHSDDFYFKYNSLEIVSQNFQQYDSEIIFGDIIYLKNKNQIFRYWESCDFKKGSFQKGWSPPHPGFFVKKEIYMKFGYYKGELGNSADIELMHRLLEKNKVSSKYIKKIFVAMNYGGASNKSFWGIIKQNIVILKVLEIQNKPLKICYFIFCKFINRINQIFKKPKKSNE
tara:strand:+ start:954 stop:1718 length:765 start_codon:yes stop_codon:yes gene_type:complete